MFSPQSVMGMLALFPAAFVAASEVTGRCTLAPDCSATVSCSDTSLELEWSDDTTLSIDGQNVEITRIKGTRVIDRISLGDTEWTIQTEGPAILISMRDLNGSIKPDKNSGHVTAAFRDISTKRYSDYLASWRVYSGSCKDLF